MFEQLGAGGMGAVFRAHDTRLQRDVALKLLPPPLFADESARLRLVREARAAAALNHPGICTIHEVGDSDGEIYIAMELVPGRPLSALVPAGGLPTETVLGYGVQIADALAHAHEHGVIHRDLKSANVVITPAGRAKVLDFGLARRPPGGGDAVRASADPTLTETGAIVGTPHYLAPEVLRGERGDRPSDIWALGVLLHELLAGALPFSGRTGFELSAAILNQSPAPLPPRVPPGLRALVERCMAKDPAQRFRNAGEVRAALEALQSGSAATAAGAPAARRWVFRAVRTLVLAGIVAGAGWIAVRQPWRSKELKQRQLTSNPAENLVAYGVISPDGKTLAMVDLSGLSLRAIDSGESNALKIPDGFTLAGYPFPMVSWFPDGSQLLLSGRAPDGTPYAWALPVLAGRARKIIVGGELATFSRDGSHLAYVKHVKDGNDIWCSGPNGEEPRRIAASDSSGTITTWAVWSPSGRRVVYTRGSQGPQGIRVELESCDLQGHRRRALSNPPGQSIHPLAVSGWLPDGRLVFGLSDPAPSQADMNLWSLHVDPNSGEPSGKPRRITQWQRLSFLVPTATSADGKRLSVDVLQYQSDCYVGSLAGGDSALKDVIRLTRDDRFDLQPSWTPDGKAILFASDRNGSWDIFRQPLDATEAEPLVTGPGDQFGPRMSPDGAWILFKDGGVAPFKPASQGARIMRMPVTGGPPEKVLDTQASATIRCGLRAGGPCVLSELDHGQMVFTAFDPVRGRGLELARTPAEGVLAWDLSPDGTALVVADQQDSLRDLRVISTRGGATRNVRMDHRLEIVSVAWAADGASWLIVGTDAKTSWRLARLDPDGKTTALIPPQLWMYSSAASPDGRHVVYTSNTGDANIWLLEDF